MNLNAMSKLNFCLTSILLALFLANITFGQEIIPLNGTGNNTNNPDWGSVGAEQVRIAPAAYADGVSQPLSGEKYGRKNARTISNIVFSQDESKQDLLNLSDFTWAFGQFVDHDITLSKAGTEFAPIIVPEDDAYFKKGDIILFNRSEYDPESGEATGIPRAYLNATTSFIDGSAIYGTDQQRADWLRTFIDGKLKVSSGNLLPWNTQDGELNGAIDYNAPHMDDDTKLLRKYYVAGDVRANENPILIAIHTLFVREHNRLCEEYKKDNPNMTDEELYQAARHDVIGMLQNITFNEWLPVMGIKLPDYSGYNENVNPNIFNEFSTAAFRLGHTLINSDLIRMSDNGEEISRGNISLRDAFFNPLTVGLAGGVEPYLKGMATQVQQDFDNKVIDDLRNFLFGSGGVGLDLAAINIERGRDRGLADYNTIRASLGMPRVKEFSDICSIEEDVTALSTLYESVDNIDPWVGMLTEKHIAGTLYGELVLRIMRIQFQNLRDGDRFYFENRDIPEAKKRAYRNTTLRDIVMRNTNISLMQDEIFKAMPHTLIEEGPELKEFPLEASIYPNPVYDHGKLKLFMDYETTVNFRILDMNGEVIVDRDKHVYEGFNYISLDGDLEYLSAGVYNIVVQSGERYRVLKLIKV